MTSPSITKAANELAEKVATQIAKNLGMYSPEHHPRGTGHAIGLIKSGLTPLNLEQLLADKVSNQRLFQLLKADYDHEWPYEDENTKAHRELMLAAISAAMEKGGEK